MAAETITIDVVINSRNNTSAGMNSAKQTVDRFTQSTQKAKKELDKLGGTNATPKVSLVDKASAALSKIDNGLSKIGRTAIKAPVKILDYATKPLRMITNALFSIKGLIMGIGTAWAANKLFSEPISVADAYSSAKIGFSTLLGDEAGQNMMDKLDEFAKATPFKTSGVISNANKMLAMGWNPEDIIKDMEIIGNAAASTGKMDQGLESIVRALAQIKTKGKLSTEELNQLSEAGIAAKAMLAEQLGYGTGDAGIAKMSADLEKGLIGSEVAVQALLEGMKKFDGTMERTANETVEGLKSQLADTFEINILRRWGQGLQDGAKRGFGSILELLDKSEGTLEKFGDTVYEIGKELSNWAADKLENTIDKILEVTSTDRFKDASLFGKVAILWDEVIAKPFSEWWSTKGKPYMVDKAKSIGETLGSGISNTLIGISNAILGFLGEDQVVVKSESIGGSFAEGFLKGFKGKEVFNAIIKAAVAAFKAGIKAAFSNGWIATYISTVLAVKLASGIAKGVQMWYGAGAPAGSYGTSGLGYSGGIKGFLGGASTANGVLEGSGLIGGLAKLGSLATGNGGLVGSLAPQSGGGLAFAGGITALGTIGGIAGLGNTVVDLTRTIKATSKNDKTLYGTRTATKASMLGIGAGIGTLIAPGIGTAIGAGLGGLATFFFGNKLADSISGVTKTMEELNEEAEELAGKQMAERFGEVTLSAEELAERVKEVFGDENRDRINKFNNSLKNLQDISDSVLSYQSDIGYTHERIMGKETLSESDVVAYREALEGYSQAVKQLLTTNKTATTNAFSVLYGDDKKGLADATRTMNEAYGKLEITLSEKSAELNNVIAEAFNDGVIDLDEEKKINEIYKQIEEIQNKVEERMNKVSEAESAATWDLIAKKYTGDENLTAEQFKEFIDEVNKQAESDLKTYDEAYIKTKAEIDVEFELGEIDSTEYNNKLKDIEQKWLDGKSTTVQRNVDVTFDVLRKNYSKEFMGMLGTMSSHRYNFSKNDILDLNSSTRDIVAESYKQRETGKNEIVINWSDDSVMEFEDMKNSWLKDSGINLASQKEMAIWYEQLKPQEEDLLALKSEWEAAGKEVPQWIQESLDEIANVKLMSGDIDSFYKIVGEWLAKDDPTYARALKDAKEKLGQDIPQALIDGLNEGLRIDVSEIAENALGNLAKDGYIEIEKDGILKITAKGGIDYDDVDQKTKELLDKLKEEGLIEIDKEGKVNFIASIDSESVENAKKNVESQAKTSMSGNIDISKNGNIAVLPGYITGAETVSENAYSRLDSAAGTKFATPISKDGNLTINALSVSSSAAINSGWAAFKEDVKAKFNNTITTTTTVTTILKRRFGAAPTSKKEAEDEGPSANGRFVDKPITTLVGEAGPEYIIPVGANRKQRGKYLWERAGRALGLFGASDFEKVYANANGGLYGFGASRIGDMMNSATSKNGTKSVQNGSRPVKVDVGGIQIHISGGNGAEDIMNNMDAISEQIALAIESAFENMPLAVE